MPVHHLAHFLKEFLDRPLFVVNRHGKRNHDADAELFI